MAVTQMSEIYKDKIDLKDKKDGREIRGIITRGVGGLYAVRCGEGDEILCRARGILRHEQLTPTVGDNYIKKPID